MRIRNIYIFFYIFFTLELLSQTEFFERKKNSLLLSNSR